jgi:hypothetical protein
MTAGEPMRMPPQPAFDHFLGITSTQPHKQSDDQVSGTHCHDPGTSLNQMVSQEFRVTGTQHSMMGAQPSRHIPSHQQALALAIRG